MSPRRIDPLLRHAQDKEDAAARELAEQQRALATQEARLAELRRYAEEYARSELRRYAEEYARSEALPVSAALLANRHAFLARIDEALTQQSKAVDSSREQVDHERARLLLASRDKQVLEQLAASYRAQERQVVERRSQRELDDLGARRVRAASAEAEGSEESR